MIDTYTEKDMAWWRCHCRYSTTECVSQEELASVNTEMERKVDQLQSQLHYWQNVTVSAVKDHCSSINTGFYSSLAEVASVIELYYEKVRLEKGKLSWCLLFSASLKTVSKQQFLPIFVVIVCN